MIQVDRVTNPCFQLPKQFSTWTPACQLVEPAIDHPIFAESTIRVRLKVPDALKVAVVNVDIMGTPNTEKWTHLEQQEDTWTGVVETGMAGNLLKLFVKQKKNPDAYSCALQFQVSNNSIQLKSHISQMILIIISDSCRFVLRYNNHNS